jgi:hypothetical protein
MAMCSVLGPQSVVLLPAGGSFRRWGQKEGSIPEGDCEMLSFHVSQPEVNK